MRTVRAIKSMCVAVGFAAAIVPCGRVYASASPVTANLINVVATSGGYEATFTEVFPVGSFDGMLSWALPAPLTLSDGGVDIAAIQDMSVNFNADPEVDLAFSLLNSSLTEPVLFNVRTATIVFTPVTNAQAMATAQMTATQGAGSPAGVTVTGMLTNSNAYEARYSTDNIVNTQDIFASLVPTQSFPFGGAWGATLPAMGYSALGTTVHMMESEFKFVLSAGDQASGTSHFEIIPEPGTLVILSLGGVLAIRRRRSH